MLFAVMVSLFSVSVAAEEIPEPVAFHDLLTSDGYLNHRQMTRFLREIADNHSDFVTLYTIGESVKGRALWVLKLQSPRSTALGTPHIKFVGNIHGNEPVGKQLILYLAEYFIKNYEADSEVKLLLDSTIIHLLPSLNPDGFEEAEEGDCFSGPGRRNGNDVDLNRSFPEFLKKNEVEVQPETEAVIRWMTDVQFLLSASFHGGTLVANYPYDGIFDSEQDLLDVDPRVSLTPDDDVFKHLALTYSRNHPSMHKNRTCDSSQPSFPGGITNGALWYSFLGGMQDYNYIFGGCMELTLEVSCCKYPRPKHLPRLWEENKKAIVELAKQAQMGVRGLIVDKETSACVPSAILRISGRSIPFNSTKKGEFWRILLPGNYILILSKQPMLNKPLHAHKTVIHHIPNHLPQYSFFDNPLPFWPPYFFPKLVQPTQSVSNSDPPHGSPFTIAKGIISGQSQTDCPLMKPLFGMSSSNRIEAKGYHSQKFPFSVPHGNGSWPTFTWLNIRLQPLNGGVSESDSVQALATRTSHFFSFNFFIWCSIILSWFTSNERFK